MRKYSNYTPQTRLQLTDEKPEDRRTQDRCNRQFPRGAAAKEIIERYAIEDTIVLEAREEALVFRNKRDKRLSWEDTFKEMAREREDWSDFEGTVADGLDPAERW